ncbi:MAG: AMP-binding protein [Trueperaceae bacterium]|nr:AMP-binding protein [Trueperaceae bacterium]
MIFDIAKKRADLSPRQPALFWRNRWYSYSELNERAEALAASLAAKGIKKGDRVSILAFNHVAHLDLILATAKLGFIYTPFNYRLSKAEQEHMAAYLEPSLCFFDSHAAATIPQSLERIALEDYEDWLEPPGNVPDPGLSPEDIQMILPTGGTTGLPKGAMQPYRQGFYNAVNTVLSWGLEQSDCTIQSTPCFHASVNAFVVPLFHLGARVVLQESFSPSSYLRLVETHRATLLFLVPTMYKMLTDEPGFSTSDFSSVRWAISGGAPCPEPVREAFAQKKVAFKQGYGLTEAGVNCFTIALEEAEARPDSVGKPVLYTEACLKDEAGSTLRQGEIGELCLKGEHIFTGYYQREEATRAVLRDGWLATGDLARQDEEGFYYIVGRKKDMFISGGENIYPIEIENLLYDHEAVSECSVLGIPDEHWGEVGLACIVLKPEASTSSEALKSYLSDHLARYKVPKHFVFHTFLPKSGTGKILKTALKDAFLAEPQANAQIHPET